MTYRTPGVYVEEIASLPPSVAEVATAIPAFIGYTAAEGNNGDGRYVAFVNNMIEYTAIFGGPSLSTYSLTTETVTISANPIVSVERIKKDGLEQTTESHKHLMYYIISHYFQNGGGRCCVVSVGKYGADYSKEDFEDGLSELEKEDEPTLIVLTDAVNLPSSQDYYDVCKAALQQCNRLGDRFAIFDIFQSDSLTDPVKEFRDKIGMEYLKYGASTLARQIP